MKTFTLSEYYNEYGGLRILNSNTLRIYVNIWRRGGWETLDMTFPDPYLYIGAGSGTLNTYAFRGPLRAVILALLDRGEPLLAPFLLALLNFPQTRPIFLEALQ